MGKNSRLMFEKEFTLERVVNQTFELYKKVLEIWVFLDFLVFYKNDLLNGL